MKVLLSWLREFAPDIDGRPEDLAEVLADLGLAVEEISHLGGGLDGVVVAEVLATRPHPDADRIQLVDVDAGDGEALQVCCGAFNMAVGDRVPLATVGTTMPNGMEIARRRMRGQWSNGMLCSGAEIAMGEDHGGILILDPDFPLGVPLVEALGVRPDVRFDLEVNPNRPDAMSMMGVARDLAARLGVPFSPAAPRVVETGLAAARRASVSIAAPDLCGRFGVRVLDDVPSGPSPRWMANRLRAVGQRPINAVVDLSNYVMFELGQPNHTYDLDLVPGGELGVRMARSGERMITLDGADRTLTGDDGVIVDGDDRPIGLAGIMGGASTEISAGTRSVLLEAAWWDPMTIARTARRLGLRSEASARFERGTDPDVIPTALDRFVELAAELGATTDTGMIDTIGNRPEPVTVRVRPRRVNSILGTELSAGEMTGLLEPIGFACGTDDDGEGFDVNIPSWRPDSSTEIDVIEEVGRLWGFSRIARTVPVTEQAGTLTPRQQDRRRIRALLWGMGITEAMPLPFLAPGDLARAGLGDDGITVTNPLVAEESVMRTSLRPGLLRAVAYNAARRTTGVSLFEIGRVHPGTGDDLPDECEHLAVILAGRKATAATSLWRRLARNLAVANPEVVNQPMDGLHPVRSGKVVAGGRTLEMLRRFAAGNDAEPPDQGGHVDSQIEVGALGEIDPQVLDAYEINERVAWLEVNLDTLLGADREPPPYRPPSRYPSSDVDLAFVVPDEVSADDVAATITGAGGELLASVTLFDVFRSDRLGENRRSLAFALRFEAPDRTLNDAEVAQVRQDCIDAVTDTHNATLRG